MITETYYVKSNKKSKEKYEKNTFWVAEIISMYTPVHNDINGNGHMFENLNGRLTLYPRYKWLKTHHVTEWLRSVNDFYHISAFKSWSMDWKSIRDYLIK